MLLDSRADLLLLRQCRKRAIVEVAHRIAAGESVQDIRDVRGTAFVRKRVPEGWRVIDSTSIDRGRHGHRAAHQPLRGIFTEAPSSEDAARTEQAAETEPVAVTGSRRQQQ